LILTRKRAEGRLRGLYIAMEEEIVELVAVNHDLRNENIIEEYMEVT